MNGWTQAETDYLRANAHVKSRREIARVLKRTSRSINQKAWRLGLTGGPVVRCSWPPDQVDYLKTNFDPEKRTQSAREIAASLDRPFNSVLAKAKTLGLLTPRRQAFRLWTEQEVATLIFKCEEHSIEELAKMLGRPYIGVRDKLKQLGCAPLCGTYSFLEMRNNTGYCESQLLRAKKALKQEWHKPFGNRYAITKKQYDALIDYLKNEGNEAGQSQVHQLRAAG